MFVGIAGQHVFVHLLATPLAVPEGARAALQAVHAKRVLDAEGRRRDRRGRHHAGGRARRGASARSSRRPPGAAAQPKREAMTVRAARRRAPAAPRRGGGPEPRRRARARSATSRTTPNRGSSSRTSRRCWRTRPRSRRDRRDRRGARRGPVDLVADRGARLHPRGAGRVAHGGGVLPVRKAGKLPRAHERCRYTLEYGRRRWRSTATRGAGRPRLVVDDVLATGGTAAATAVLVSARRGVTAWRS